MAYPDIDYNPHKSSFTPNKGQRRSAFQMAVDGTVYKDNRQANRPYDIKIVHEMLTTAERDQLLTYYAANADSWVTFNRREDGSTWVVLMDEPVEEVMATAYWRVTVAMMGHKQ